ncbi:MAG: S8 family serine peptidase [Luteibacter sp.]
MKTPVFLFPVAYRIAVRLRPGYEVSAGSIQSTASSSVADVARDTSSIAFEPALPRSAEGRLRYGIVDFEPLASLAFVANRDTPRRDDLAGLAARLRACDAILDAWIEPRNVEPWDPAPPAGLAKSVPRLAHVQDETAAPDLLAYQEYLDDPFGIDVWFAWSLGVGGWWVSIADIEWSYRLDHRDMAQPGKLIEVLPSPDESYRDHGCAVTGVMYGLQGDLDHPRGIVGGVFGADALYAVSELVLGRPAGIVEGLKHLRPGDVFLLEMQTGGEGPDDLVPADFDRSVWDVISQATQAGIVIVLTGGNGNVDLDGPYYAEYRARADNGAIRLGAGTKIGRHKASFSTYGSPIHVQGTGDWSVFSTGYGDFVDYGPDDNYTSVFSGTSAAGPIVATAAVAIQSWYAIKTGGSRLTSIQMRDLLVSTGRPQGSGGHIGPLPDLRAALTRLQRELNRTAGQLRYGILDAPSPDEIEQMRIGEADIERLTRQAAGSRVASSDLMRLRTQLSMTRQLTERVARLRARAEG